MNLLLTSSGNKTTLVESINNQLHKDFEEINILCADSNENVLTNKLSYNFEVLPYFSKLSKVNLLNFLKSFEVNYIIPTSDEGCLYFSKYKNILESYNVKIMVSSNKTVKAVNDKLVFFNDMMKLNIDTIETSLNINDLKSKAKYIAKNRYGSGSKEQFIIYDTSEAKKILINYPSLIFQEYVNGIEISVDFYVSIDKKLKGLVARSRDYVIGGESHVTSVVDNNIFLPIINKLIEFYDFYGHINAQFIVDKSRIRILEINPRIGGASTLSMKVGLKSVYWFLIESMGLDLSTHPFKIVDDIKYMVRTKKDYFF